MTSADAVDYVSDLDPCKRKTKTARDPDDPSKGFDESWDVQPGATSFKLRSLDVFLMSVIYDNAQQLRGREGSNEFGIQANINQTNVQAVRHGLIGFTNFCDAKGNAIAYETQKENVNGRPYDVVSDTVMNRMGVRLIQELAAKIKEISEVTPKDEKKSVEPSLRSA
jgi:hypothetical protein